LLRGVVIERPNQVWSTDITDLRIERGWTYRVALIDWHSRSVLALAAFQYPGYRVLRGHLNRGA